MAVVELPTAIELLGHVWVRKDTIGRQAPERWYTVSELAEATGWPRSTLSAEVAAGRLRAVTPNGLRRGARVSMSDFQAWLDSASTRGR